MHYQVILEAVEPVPGNPPLNSAQHDVVHEDLPWRTGPDRYWRHTTKPYDHIHAYLGVAAFDSLHNQRFETPPTVLRRGDNYFATSFWSEDRKEYISRQVDREPLGRGGLRNPRPPEPMIIDRLVISNQPLDHAAITVVAETRTNQANRAFLAQPDVASEVACYIEQRVGAAARSWRGSEGDLPPPPPPRGPGCEPVWSLVQTPSMTVRFGSQLIEGCDGYVFSKDFVLSGAELDSLTAWPQGGETTLIADVDGYNHSGCITWAYNSGGGVYDKPEQKERINVHTRTRVRVRVRRVRDIHPSFPPLPPPVGCTLRPMQVGVNGIDRWQTRWTDERGRVVVEAYKPQDKGLSLTSKEAFSSVASYGHDRWPAPNELFRYSGETRTEPNGNHYFDGPATPDSPMCSHFVGLPDPADVADNNLVEHPDTVVLEDGARVSLYGEFDPDGRYLVPRLRYTRGVWGDEDHLLYVKALIY